MSNLLGVFGVQVFSPPPHALLFTIIIKGLEKTFRQWVEVASVSYFPGLRDAVGHPGRMHTQNPGSTL
jgi:hypothetical protein